MNMDRFEKEIDKKILKRGYDYYIQGHVMDTYEQGDQEYMFQIQGGYDDYEVNVKLGEGGQIVYSFCDCPYDAGPVCKHEVAAYYELSDRLQSKEKTLEKKGQPKAAKQPELADVLNGLSKEELIGIIQDFARKDPIFKNNLMIRYVQGDASYELATCQKLIHTIIRTYKGREGFIAYRDTPRFANEMIEIAEKARNTRNQLLATDIALLLLEEAMGALQYADDSDGSIGGLVDEALEVIREIAADSLSLDSDTRGEIFNRLLSGCGGDFLKGWENFRVQLLEICVEFADMEDCRNKLSTAIHHWMLPSSHDYYSEYTNEELLGLLLKLTEQYGTEQETEQMIMQHLHYSSIREKYIRKLMQEGKFHEAASAASAGEAQDKLLPGLVTRWKKLRYAAYRALSLQEEQEALAMELLLEGDFEFYAELKRLAAGKHASLYERLKQELKGGKDWRTQSLYLRLIEEERDLAALMIFVQDHPSYIESYAGRLVTHYKDEVIQIYQAEIRSTAKSASNRKQYKNVCRLLSKFKKLAGQELQQDLIRGLREDYARRPAFIDELSQLK
jgi:hypothetical protein